MDAGFVAERSAQPQDPHAVVDVNLIFDIDTAFGGRFGVPVVVVSVDIEYGRAGESGQKGQVIRI